MTDVEWAAISIAGMAVSYAVSIYTMSSRRAEKQISDAMCACEKIANLRHETIVSDITEIKEQIACIKKQISELSELFWKLSVKVDILLGNMEEDNG